MIQKRQKTKPAAPKAPSLGDSLRERVSIVSKDDSDIGDIWAEQRRIKRENLTLEKNYRESKRKAKELKRQIRLNQIGKADSVLDSAINRTKKVSNLTKDKVTSQEQFKKIKSTIIKRSGSYTSLLKHKSIFAVLAILFVGSLVLFTRINGSETGSTRTDTLGQSVSSDALVEKLTFETPEFSLLFPPSKSIDNTEVARVSPEDKVAAYAFIDDYQGAKFRVSQQELPPEFRTNKSEELEKLAKSFQASSIIELNGEKIYHGFSENNGGVQSIIFITMERLVLIASSEKISDDSIVSYVLGLNYR